VTRCPSEPVPGAPIARRRSQVKNKGKSKDKMIKKQLMVAIRKGTLISKVKITRR
jgi:hypothetical protein